MRVGLQEACQTLMGQMHDLEFARNRPRRGDASLARPSLDSRVQRQGMNLPLGKGVGVGVVSHTLTLRFQS